MISASRKLALAVPVSEDWLSRLREAHPGWQIQPYAKGAPLQQLADAEVILAGFAAPPTDALMDAAPKLRWIHSYGAGVDRVLTPRLAFSDVQLTNNSGVHGPNVAEHVMALMLSFARGLPQLMRAQQARLWLQEGEIRDRFELGGQTLVIVGLGAIGRALAVRAHAFGLRVIGVQSTPKPAPAGVEEIVGEDRLDEVLARADHVAVILPLTPDTHGLFNHPRLFGIKRGAYFYNVGRGQLVDQNALVEALHCGHLAGAGIDVTDPEPLPSESPLWTQRNVILTAHSAGNTPHYMERTFEIFSDNLRLYEAGLPLNNLVDKALGY